MESRIDNSFFRQDYHGSKVLLIVPHQDDEINTAGAFLQTLTSCGAEVFLVYTTNGDWKYDALTRMKEAVNAAAVLGIKKENIFFLGYGDAINNDKHDHLFYAEGKATRSSSGHCETYGTELYADYPFLKENRHHPYTRDSFFSDVISIVAEIKAELIICTDFDEHPDHRMLSLFFDRAIGVIRKTYPDYKPEIWKRFAYSLSYTAKEDYSAINNPSTARPCKEFTGKYEFDFIDSSLYLWNNRVRVPVAARENENLRTSTLLQALKKHRSQSIVTKAGRIINSDEVFWTRRTDSCSYSASVTVSSGNGSYLNDFMLFNVMDVDSPCPLFTDYCWRPDNDDPERKALLQWEESQTVRQIVIYGNIDARSQIRELMIRLSDGYQTVVKDIPNNGNPLAIDIGEHPAVFFCELTIMKAEGDGYGIAEFELYSVPERNSMIAPFCKVLTGDCFMNEFIVDDRTDEIPLSMYAFGTEGKAVFQVINGRSSVTNGILHFDKADREIVLKGSIAGSDAWDQIIVKRLNREELECRQKECAADLRFLRREKKKQKIRNMLYLLKKQGVASVFRRVYRNIILPRIRKNCV